jgi:Protein of unknown function (DUF3276)
LRKIERVDYENQQKRFESVYSTKVRAGKRRTYFFDVRKTKGDDFYITLTESTKRFEGDGYERHKIFLYKEDFNRFLTSLSGAIDHVKTELMPDYDYDEFTRRQAEWEEKRSAMDLEAAAAGVAADAAAKPLATTKETTSEYIGETEKNVTPEEVTAPLAAEVESAEAVVEESVSSMATEEVPPAAVSEEASPSVVSDEAKEAPAETDEDDMSW